MMNIQENFSLKALNTFGIDAKARYFSEFHSKDELIHLLMEPLSKQSDKMILGGGSNILFTKDFEGLVLKNSIKGIEIIEEDDEHVYIKAGAGVVWHDLVLFSIQGNYGGIENLSLIPGTVGASPMQNIGAYGVEIKDTFDALEAINVEDGSIKVFRKEDCNFGYRDSVFKKSLKGKYVIVSVTYRLSKNPVFNISYGAIKNTLDELGIKELTVKAVSDAVCNIRRSKLPDPADIGNAGSFFKNPEIPELQFEDLKKDYPDIPCYKTSPGMVKIPAGWLNEQCGWKGKVVGNTGVHKNQALVLVNYGKAKGNEIKQLSFDIVRSVKEKFGIELETEVNII